MADQPRIHAKRRWFQFSLRAMLLALTGLAVFFALWANRAHKQKRAVDLIHSLGGRVYYQHQIVDDKGLATMPSRKPRPVWLSDLLAAC